MNSGLASFCRNVAAVAYKEWMLLRQNRILLGVTVAQPVIFFFLFGVVLSSRPANVPWGVLDQSRTALSRRLVAEVQASGYFLPARPVAGHDEGTDLLRRGDILALLVVPPGFARDALRGGPEVQVLLDGADPISAARVGAYLRAIAASLDVDGSASAGRGASADLELRQHFWFNPTMTDRRFLLATLAGMLLTNLCLSVSSMGLVAEKEEGTWEQTLALPVSVVELVLGKLLPDVALCYAVLAFALVGPGLLYGIWPAGSVPALLLLTLPFVMATMTLGVFISTLASTVAQGVFITVFFIMPSFVLSGVMLPYQLMPDGPRAVGALMPLRWYQIGLRRIHQRGGGLDDVLLPMLALVLTFATLLVLVRLRTRPRLA